MWMQLYFQAVFRGHPNTNRTAWTFVTRFRHRTQIGDREEKRGLNPPPKKTASNTWMKSLKKTRGIAGFQTRYLASFKASVSSCKDTKKEKLPLKHFKNELTWVHQFCHLLSKPDGICRSNNTVLNSSFYQPNLIPLRCKWNFWV